MLCLWDAAMSGESTTERRATPGLSSSHTNIAPRAIMRDHQAAVKALSWCPWQRNTLASGGGTADRTLRIWNASNDTAIKSVDTGSQVCSIQWSDAHKELVSSHGFSDNQLILWKYSNMTKVHSQLYISISIICFLYSLAVVFMNKDPRVSWAQF